MRVLVTGKNGFIANAFARHAGGHMEVELVSVRDSAWKSIDFSKYDCVLHAAGMAHVGYKDENQDAYMAINRDLTLDIARAAKAEGVKHFVFLSSIIVYGPAAPGGQTRVITPETPPAPENAYGLSKLEAENGLAALDGAGFAVSILRLPMVWGEGSRGNYALLKKYARFLPVFPKLCGRRSAIGVDALAEYIVSVISKPVSGIFFPTDDMPFTTSGMLASIRAERGRKTWLTSALNPAVRLTANSGPGRRIFGGIEYSEELRNHPKSL